VHWTDQHRITDVLGSLVTHQHCDHLGLAARVREASGAWIAMHPADRDAIARPDFRDPELSHPADLKWLLYLGASLEEAQRLRGDGRGWWRWRRAAGSIPTLRSSQPIPSIRHS
jgi:glyoxylase-like metal-dependent hydrolase (beta-lactamase superfamily II)